MPFDPRMGEMEETRKRRMDIRLDTRYSKSFRTLVGISEDRYCLLSRRRKESRIFPLICMRRCAQLWKLIRHRASIKFRMDRPRICFVQSRLSFEQEYNRGGFEIVENWTRLVSTRFEVVIDVRKDVRLDRETRCSGGTKEGEAW